MAGHGSARREMRLLIDRSSQRRAMDRARAADIFFDRIRSREYDEVKSMLQQDGAEDLLSFGMEFELMGGLRRLNICGNGLEFAVMRCDMQMVELLLDYGASPDKNRFNGVIYDDEDAVVFRFSALWEASTPIPGYHGLISMLMQVNSVLPQSHEQSDRVPMFLYLLSKWRRAAAFDHWRRIAPLVGRIRRALILWFNEVHYRPGGDGQRHSQQEFEAALSELRLI